MPITSVTQARDDIISLFKTYWDANTAAITGTVPQVVYGGLEEVSEPPSDLPWVRVSVIHGTGGQASFGDTGGRHFDRNGIVTIQLFVPLKDNGMVTMDQLIQVALDSIEGKCTSNGVWFRNVRINEQGPDRAWFNVNVLADFEYYTVK